MGFNIGGSKSKSSSTSSVDKTSMPVVPDWIQHQGQSLFAGNASVGGGKAADYVAGADPLQTQAAGAAGSLGSDKAWYDQAMGGPTPTVSAASLLEGLDSYMSPYLKNVRDAAMTSFDFDAGAAKAQEDLDIASQSGFGGSGAAITKSMSEAARVRERGGLEAGILDQGFQVGAGLSSQDAGRRQSASEANAQLAQQDAQWKAQLGLDRDANDRANIGLQAGMGEQMRGIADEFAKAPMDLQAWLNDQFGKINPAMFVGQRDTGTTTGTGKTSGSSWGMSASAADIGKILGAF